MSKYPYPPWVEDDKCDIDLKEEEFMESEVSRLRGMIAYAKDAPDFDSCKSILVDALNGVNGAENYEEVKGELETLRNNAKKLIKVVEWMTKEAAKHDEMKRDAVTLGLYSEYSPCECKMCRALRGDG